MRLVTWVPLNDAEATSRLRTILERWEGTRYMPGQQCLGAGVDCVRFVCAVYDELLETKTPIDTLPPDVSIHNAQMAEERTLQLRNLYEADEISGCEVCPGDAIVTGPKNGGPGHVMIVGPDKNVLFHAMAPMVQRTGIRAMQMFGHRVFHVYRIKGWR